jgi:hypothetical protein
MVTNSLLRRVKHHMIKRLHTPDPVNVAKAPKPKRAKEIEVSPISILPHVSPHSPPPQ